MVNFRVYSLLPPSLFLFKFGVSVQRYFLCLHGYAWRQLLIKRRIFTRYQCKWWNDCVVSQYNVGFYYTIVFDNTPLANFDVVSNRNHASNGRPPNVAFFSNVRMASDNHGYAPFLLKLIFCWLEGSQRTNLTVPSDFHYLKVASHFDALVQYRPTLYFYALGPLNDGLARDIVVSHGFDVIVSRSTIPIALCRIHCFFPTIYQKVVENNRNSMFLGVFFLLPLSFGSC
mmetsp:Transcript_24484/g.67646  ORF Transcript_24484/g.67646 Transcript_24484/m.67646 type:complete len:229 (-) Transcript_24484:256-942(-)